MNIEKVCPVCKKVFAVDIVPDYVGTHKYIKDGKTYCSRECASKGSVTDYRRQRARDTVMNNPAWNSVHNAENMARILKQREKPRYVNLKKELTRLGISHEFECCMGDYVYDLCLAENKIVFEFDEKYHCGKQIQKDSAKTSYAEKLGYTMYRIPVAEGEIIPIEGVFQVLQSIGWVKN